MHKSSKTEISWDELRGITAENGATPQTLEALDCHISRRRFLGHTTALAALTGFGVGVETLLQNVFGRGLIPSAWAADAEKKTIAGKPDMKIYNDRPINGEFAPHLLDDDVTPSARHFVRNNGSVPERATNKDLQGWNLTIDGEVNRPLKLTLDDLRKLPAVTMPLLIECGGNGRAHFEPSVRGNPWDRGAVGCSAWTGVRLRDVLKMAELKSSAVYTGHYGEDPGLGNAEVFSRGIPIDKAMEEHTIIAYQMNGQDLEPLNGYPVRLVVPGWIGSCSQKWLSRIWIRDQVHDTSKMKGFSYRVPAFPVVPGTKPAESDMVIATAWLIKSMITQPTANAQLKPGDRIKARGHAWAGENKVSEVLLSVDYGTTWKRAKLRQPANRYAWYTFEGDLGNAKKGYHEIWARAFDDKGDAQPFRQPWNPRGYMGNVIHRVPIQVGV